LFTTAATLWISLMICLAAQYPGAALPAKMYGARHLRHLAVSTMRR
jgi:hypothetical protein